MKRYLYLMLTPESLVASMLPPFEFGTYMAVGTKKMSRGQAIYFEVDMELAKGILPMDYIDKRCVPTATGEPKRSVYVKIYRALESTPLKALRSLYLATHDGRVLELQQGKYDVAKEQPETLHYYQEIAPIAPSVASTLPPSKYLYFITDESHPVNVPKLVFTELALDALATDPEKGSAENLPYPRLDHLRDCLLQLKQDPKKLKKTVVRNPHHLFLYRTCRNGFYVGAKNEIIFYPYPKPAEMNEKHHEWWRSANAVLLSHE